MGIPVFRLDIIVGFAFTIGPTHVDIEFRRRPRTRRIFRHLIFQFQLLFPRFQEDFTAKFIVHELQRMNEIENPEITWQMNGGIRGTLGYGPRNNELVKSFAFFIIDLAKQSSTSALEKHYFESEN